MPILGSDREFDGMEASTGDGGPVLLEMVTCTGDVDEGVLFGVIERCGAANQE